MAKTLRFLLSVGFLFLASQAQALPGIAAIRWSTVYNLPGGGAAYADVVVDNYTSGTIFPPGASDSDGTLSIANYTLNSANNVAHFSGTWFRGGQQGPFNFTVIYNSSGQATALKGFYSSPDSGSMMLPWNSK